MKRDSDPGATTARVDLAVEPVAVVGPSPLASLGADQAVAVPKPGPPPHGHMPDREFVIADYDGDRKTIVLAGLTAYGREVHDMDRLDEPAGL